MKKTLPVTTKFTYHINLDERGSFYADVRDSSGGTVYEINIEGDDDDSSIFEDGFMKHKNDVSGLEEYLKDLGIIPATATLCEPEDPNSEYSYEYFIHATEEEDGYFHASVVSFSEITYFEIKIEGTPDDSSIFKDGFMAHEKDVVGLEKYLKNLHIIPPTATLKAV